MKFVDKFTSRENRYSIGIEEQSGKFYLSIPVSNRVVDYEEYYEITEKEYLNHAANSENIIEFSQGCRNHKNDNLLFIKPGNDRGVG
jgi:hypothetical protein